MAGRTELNADRCIWKKTSLKGCTPLTWVEFGPYSFLLSLFDLPRALVQCTQKPAQCPVLLNSDPQRAITVGSVSLPYQQPRPVNLLSNISDGERPGLHKSSQFSHESTWEQSSPGQCFGSLIPRPTRLFRRSSENNCKLFSPKLDRGIMLSKDLPDIEVNYYTNMFLIWPLFSVFCLHEQTMCLMEHFLQVNPPQTKHTKNIFMHLLVYYLWYRWLLITDQRSWSVYNIHHVVTIIRTSLHLSVDPQILCDQSTTSQSQKKEWIRPTVTTSLERNFNTCKEGLASTTMDRTLMCTFTWGHCAHDWCHLTISSTYRSSV